MKIKSGFVVRNVGGENVGVPVGETGRTFHGMIKLNETGNFLWQFFSKSHTEEEAVAALLAEYEVEEEIARTDVKAFVDLLVKNGLAEE